MPIPATNVTCDVYRTASSPPPAAPDLSGIQGLLKCVFPRGHEPGEGTPSIEFSHTLDVALDADIRDGAQTPGTVGGDLVYIPDNTGTQFLVKFVGKVGGIRRCWLQRQNVSYPTTDL